MSSSTPAATAYAKPQLGVAAGAILLLIAGAIYLGASSTKLTLLFVIGVLLGITLYHASFGFTAAYRRAIVARDVSGMVAQLIMLGLAMVLFAPVLAQGEAFGHGVVGAVAPVGLQVALGAFLFGIGMQLGGGCGSGTLFTVGGGSTRMLLTLAAFCAGAFWGSLDLGFWGALPGLPGISIAASWGWEIAIPVQLGVLALLWLGLRAYAGSAPQRPLWTAPTWQTLLGGPWPLLLGAALLAILNWLTLLIAGHPWTITWAFTLWGAKAATVLGWDPTSNPFWVGGFQEAALNRGVLSDVTSVMDIGIILGALLAAGVAGRFAPRFRQPWPWLAASILGGLLMGYGARLAFGCNIGAFFSGVASTSLHGWLWIACALAGTWVGVRMRPWFKLEN